MAAVMATITPDGQSVAHAERHAGVVRQLQLEQSEVDRGVGQPGLGGRLRGQVDRGNRRGRQQDRDATGSRTRRGLRRDRGSPRRRLPPAPQPAVGMAAGAGGSGRTRPARTPLPITKISATSWTRTTAASPSTPSAASGIRMAIRPRERPTFCSMIDRARRAWVRVCGRWRRSSPMRATSAVSMATSLPMAPIAIPTSAVARAGASLTPSPTIAVGRSSRSRRMMADLSSGRSSACTSVMPAWAARAAAVRSLSPVSMATW